MPPIKNANSIKNNNFFNSMSKINSSVFEIKGPNNRHWYGIYPVGSSKKPTVWSNIDILDNEVDYCIIDFHVFGNSSVHSDAGKVAMHKTIRRLCPGADFRAVVRGEHPTFRFKIAYYKEVVEAMFKYMY